MKIILILFISPFFSLYIQAQSEIELDLLGQTKYYTFHNNMWMNLHHFFYEQACNRQRLKLKEDNVKFRNIGDSLKIAQLNQEERERFDACIAFYQKNIIDQELLHSGRIFKWLQNLNPNQEILDTTLSKEFTNNLNEIRPLYVTHFWQRHAQENKHLVDEYLELIESTENQVIQKMERLSGSKWNGVVRIDITTYGNWAGAYSPALNNIVLSSIDPSMHSTLFVEFTFHESSHLLFLRKSPFRMAIYNQSKSENIKPPKNLWHASMFYLSGTATKEELDKKGFNHELIMEKKHVFMKYYSNQSFKSILMDYYNQKIELGSMASQLLNLNEVKK